MVLYIIKKFFPLLNMIFVPHPNLSFPKSFVHAVFLTSSVILKMPAIEVRF